ncbi:TBPIP domain containing protein [Asbolus verrucosus]|uniref:Homologous-pairing protein 2 homolog n=1 Tax=Asbolus verrucosus TaxID=1661398 RepID=A0A482VKH0_ASBVE|nr:TBPIP domain containing protein [Asbolus verrucosus]
MDRVDKFLAEHNRPFSVNDLVQALDQMGKSKVQTALRELVAQNRVIEKSYGKQKIYCIVQSSDLPLKDVTSNIFEMERQSTNLVLKLKEVEHDLESKSVQLKKFEGIVTKSQALHEKKGLEEEVESLQTQIEGYKGKSYEKKEREAIEKAYGGVLKEYKKRKRLCMDMVDAIFENYPKSKKTLLQEIGIENDDDVNFKIKVQL